jgi:hypothetical protein
MRPVVIASSACVLLAPPALRNLAFAVSSGPAEDLRSTALTYYAGLSTKKHASKVGSHMDVLSTEHCGELPELLVNTR